MVKIKVGKAQIRLNGLESMIHRIDTKSNEPLQKMRTYMLGRISRNFASQGRLFRQPWSKLAQSTLIMKRFLAKRGQIGSSEIPLVRTGKMKDSFYGNIVRRRGGWFRLTISNTVPYFKKHQSTRSSSRQIKNLAGITMPLPRRIMMTIMSQDRTKMIQIYKDWLGIKKKKKKTTSTASSGGWIKL